jgi:hypothetical protein
LFGIPVLTMLPVMARDHLHLDASGYGALMMCFGAGALHLARDTVVQYRCRIRTAFRNAPPATSVHAQASTPPMNTTGSVDLTPT